MYCGFISWPQCIPPGSSACLETCEVFGRRIDSRLTHHLCFWKTGFIFEFLRDEQRLHWIHRWVFPTMLYKQTFLLNSCIIYCFMDYYVCRLITWAKHKENEVLDLHAALWEYQWSQFRFNSEGIENKHRRSGIPRDWQ